MAKVGKTMSDAQFEKDLGSMVKSKSDLVSQLAPARLGKLKALFNHMDSDGNRQQPRTPTSSVRLLRTRMHSTTALNHCWLADHRWFAEPLVRASLAWLAVPLVS